MYKFDQTPEEASRDSKKIKELQQICVDFENRYNETLDKLLYTENELEQLKVINQGLVEHIDKLENNIWS